MKHPRARIREAVAALLATHLPAVDARLTSGRISVHRATPLFQAKLPAILIYTRDERIEDSPHADPGLRRRVLELAVEIVARGDAAIEEAERLAQAVEFILETNETLGNTVEGSRLTRTEIDQEGEGDTPIVALRMAFEVVYWTQTPDLPLTHPLRPGVPLPAPTPTLADLVAWARDHVAGGGTLTPDVIAGWQAHLDASYWPAPTQALGSWAPEIGLPHEPRYQALDTVKGDVDVSSLPGIPIPEVK